MIECLDFVQKDEKKWLIPILQKMSFKVHVNPYSADYDA